TPARNRSATPATLNVLYPPRNLQVKSFVESSEGTAIILLCAVDSNPPAQLSLLREGQPVASSPPVRGDAPRQGSHVSPSPNALRLELREASEEDEGEYECQAQSPLGSAHVSLTLRVQAARVVVRPSAEVPEGTKVTLTCQDPHAHPGTLYTWFRNGQWVAEGLEASLGLRGRRSDAGLYSCQAGRGHRAPPAALRVLYAPQKPNFISLVDPRGGRQAVLLCSVDSCPPSDIALSRGPGQPPLASTRGPSDPRLEVQAAPNSLRVALAGLAQQDAGLYVCWANNSRGAAASTLRLHVGGVTVTAEPSPEVPEGTSATMTCSVTPWWGKGANYTWYKNGRWLQEGPDPSLVLPRVSRADSGSYHCRASGAWGTASSTPLGLSVLCECPQPRRGHRLRAGWSPRHAGCPQPTWGVPHHDPMTPLSPADPPRDVAISTFLENRSGRVGIVLCTADSHPPSTMALLHQGQLVASSLAPAAAPGVRVAPSHNALRVELGALGTGAAGRYLCVATNSLGNATASAHFDVNTLTHLQTFTILAGLLLALICVATLGLLAVKMWPRIRRFQGWSGAEDTLELRSKQEPMQVGTS
ncbi:SN protein, partial [Sakesphorus luctuosus]|nr:SN protein [Sakesphorus luctuosus]